MSSWAQSDPHFADVLLLWNMGDTVPTSPPLDSSSYAKTASTYGGASLYATDTSDGPFGGNHSGNQINQTGSGYAPPRCSVTDTSWDFNPASKTLTVEGWVKMAAVAATGATPTLRPIASAGAGAWIWPQFIYQAGQVDYEVNNNSSGKIFDNPAGVSTGVWFHYVMQLTGTVAYFACNGVRLGSYVLGVYTWNDLMLQMGGTSTGGITTGAGALLGPHRVTLGANRYGLDSSSSYTVPTAPFPTSA